MPDIDLLGQDADKPAGEAPSSGSSTSKEPINYEAKYAGLERVRARLQHELDALQKRFDDATEKHETDLARLRDAGRGGSKRVTELEALLKEAVDAKAAAENELSKIRGQEQGRKLIAEKYGNHQPLRDAWDMGDLKGPSDFTKEEDWIAYLDRQAKLAGFSPEPAEGAEKDPPADANQTDTLKGTLPKTVSRVASKNNSLDAFALAEKLMTMSPRDPKYAEIEKQYEQALAGQQ